MVFRKEDEMKFFEKGELKLLWPFYLEQLISPMLLFVPVFMIVYFRNLGLNLFQAGLIMAMIPLFSLIFEIPTGAVADLYGRKLSVLLSFALLGIGYFMLFFFTNFYVLLIIFAFLGFAATFYSGAREAWAVDIIKKNNKKLIHNYFSKLQGLGNFGLVISGFLGAFLVKAFGLSIIWPAAGISYFIAFFLLMLAKEEHIKIRTNFSQSFDNLKKQAKISIKYSYNHPVILYFLIASAVFVNFAMNLNVGLSWIPLLKGLTLPDYAFGYIWSAMAVIGILSSIASHKLLKKGKERSFIIKAILLTALFSLLVIFAKDLFFAIAILMLTSFFITIKMPAERVYFHRFIPSKLRATIGSVEGMLLSVIGIISMPIAGLLVDSIGAYYTIFLSGIILIPAAIIFYKIKESKR